MSSYGPARPAVSIIMPARNTAPYVAQAIDSALAQTAADFELIVVDDRSEDQTGAIAAAYAALDSRVRVVPGPGAGPSAARNVALAHARAPLHALLDSDDVWTPTYLEEQVAVLEREPAAAIVTANAINLGGPRDGQPLRPVKGGCRRLSLADILALEDAVCIASVFRRAVVERLGGFDERIYSNEDYDFWIRASAAGFEIIQNPQPLAFYRRRPDSGSADERRMLDGIVRVLEGVRPLCGEKELAIVDRQIMRFENERLVLDGKTALRERDFTTAAQRFSLLYSRGPAIRSALLAAASRYVPRALFRVDRFLTAIRPLKNSRAARSISYATHIASPYRDLCRSRPGVEGLRTAR